MYRGMPTLHQFQLPVNNRKLFLRSYIRSDSSTTKRYSPRIRSISTPKAVEPLMAQLKTLIIPSTIARKGSRWDVSRACFSIILLCAADNVAVAIEDEH
jgi:hypothetical protein